MGEHYVNEIQVGKKAGLDYGLNLARECADFYVLESMYHQLWQRHDSVNTTTGERTSVQLPRDFGWDSREEFRAYGVSVSLKGLEDRLAREFVVYLSLACGGELRHIRRFMSQENRIGKCEHECSSDCCQHTQTKGHLCETNHCWSYGNWVDKFKWKYDGTKYPNWADAPPGTPAKGVLPCGCSNPHVHVAGCKADKPPGCDVDGCCNHQHSNACFETIPAYTPTKRIDRYLAAIVEHRGSAGADEETDRSAGWRLWHKLSNRSLASWMNECAAAFRHPCWGGGGFGGEKWGTAAALTADFLRGKMTTRTFLDRCWSLQHNGGCIFNKFYQLDTMRNAAGRHTHTLMHVLEVQAADDYDSVADVCSPYVFALWTEHQRATGKRTILDDIERAGRQRAGDRERPTVWMAGSYMDSHEEWPFVKPNGHKYGCEACAWQHAVNAFSNPCYGLGPKDQRTNCAYFEWYTENLQQVVDPSEEEEMEEEPEEYSCDDGCVHHCVYCAAEYHEEE